MPSTRLYTLYLCVICLKGMAISQKQKLGGNKMAVKKLFGNVYYADYRDLRDIRRRVSLQTPDLQETQGQI